MLAMTMRTETEQIAKVVRPAGTFINQVMRMHIVVLAMPTAPVISYEASVRQCWV